MGTITDSPSKLAFYIRVSTAKQDFAAQLHALKEFCRRHGWKVPGEKLIFAEKESGTKAKRTQLDALCTACRDGHVDTVLCYQINRLGRSFLHLENLLAEFDGLKIRVVSVSDGRDTAKNTPEENYFRRNLATFAEYEREKIVERTRDGIAAARKKGRVGGRPAGRSKENERKIFEARLLMKTKTRGKVLSLRKVAKRVGLNAGYLSRALKAGAA